MTMDKVLAMGALQVANSGVTSGMGYTLTPIANSSAPVSAATGAVHVLEGFDAAARGSFRLSFDVAGVRYTSAEIDLHADAASLQAALLAASVLSLSDAALAGRLEAWRAAQTAAVAERPKDEA